MTVKMHFSVDRSKETPRIKVAVERGTTPRTAIECKYAALACRYFLKINQEMQIDDLPHIEDVNATIEFHGYNDFDLEFDFEDSGYDGFFGDDVEDRPDSPDIPGYVIDGNGNRIDPAQADMTTGFTLRVSSIEVVGGMATPAVIAATSVYHLINEAAKGVSL